MDQSTPIGCKIGVSSCDMGLDPLAPDDFINSQNEFGMDNDDAGPADFGCEDNDDDNDNDDPWKPLNPHEPGNLKVKPFKKGLENIYLLVDYFLIFSCC